MVSNPSTLVSDVKSLSQAIGDLQGATQRLNVVTALPPEIQQNRNLVINQLMSEINKILAHQLAIKTFVHESLPKLQRAQTNPDNPTNTTLAEETINEVRAQASDLDQTIRALQTDIMATQVKFDQFATDLARLQWDLKGQIDGSSQVMKSIKEEIERNGGFGAIFRSNALRKLAEQHDTIKADQAARILLKQSVDPMVADCSVIGQQINHVLNVLHVTQFDINDVIRDLSSGRGDSFIREIVLTMLIKRLEALQTDAG